MIALESLLLSCQDPASTGGICLTLAIPCLCWQTYAGAARFTRADVLQHAHEDQQTHQVQPRQWGGQGQGDLISSAAVVLPSQPMEALRSGSSKLHVGSLVKNGGLKIWYPGYLQIPLVFSNSNIEPPRFLWFYGSPPQGPSFPGHALARAETPGVPRSLARNRSAAGHLAAAKLQSSWQECATIIQT